MALPPKPSNKPPRPIRPGDTIGGRYEVIEELGAGGHAIVYVAKHLVTERRHALKVIRPKVMRKHNGMAESFMREARVTAKVEHPNIMEVTDAGVDEARAAPFMAMPLLKGWTLGDELEHRLAADEVRSVPWAEAHAWLEQLASALEAAHERGIVHRDLKPSNIFLAGQPGGVLQVKLMDFGIAKLFDTDNEQTATAIGTITYAAPEQLGGDIRQLALLEHGVTISRGISPATDVFAFGMVAFELLSGHGPVSYWGTKNTGIMMMQVAFRPRLAPFGRLAGIEALLPRTIEAWLERCLRHDASQRYQTVKEAFAALAALMDGFEQHPEAAGASLALDAAALQGPAAAAATAAAATADTRPVVYAPTTELPRLEGTRTEDMTGPPGQASLARAAAAIGDTIGDTIGGHVTGETAPPARRRVALLAAVAAGVLVVVVAVVMATGTNDDSAAAKGTAAQTAGKAEKPPEVPATSAATATAAVGVPAAEGGALVTNGGAEATPSGVAAPGAGRPPRGGQVVPTAKGQAPLFDGARGRPRKGQPRKTPTPLF